MRLSSVEIGFRIARLRQEIKVSRDAFATSLGLTLDDLDRIETGTYGEPLGDIILIASKQLSVDFRYLISDDIDKEEESTRTLYRALEQKSSDDIRAVRRFIRLAEAEWELEKLLVIEPRALPPPRNRTKGLHKEFGAFAAREERKRLKLEPGPIENIFNVLRSSGVRVCRQPLRDSSLSGLTVLNPRFGAAVLINFDEDLYRQFFSAAHEFGHVVMDRQTLVEQQYILSYSRYSSGELLEIQANAFAAEFLLPLEDVKSRGNEIQRDPSSTIRRLAEEYRVNIRTASIQVKKAGLVAGQGAKGGPVLKRFDKVDPELSLDLSDRQRARRLQVLKTGISSSMLELLRRAVVEDKISLGRFAEILDKAPTEAKQFAADIGLAI